MTSNLIERSRIATSFAEFLNSFRETSPLNAEDVGTLIWHDMAGIRAALHDYSGDVDRKKIWTISEIFQDLIAHYLRRTLPENYRVKIEQSVGETKIQPDIVVFKDEKPHAVIEVKVRVGWKRAYFADKLHEARAKVVASEVGVSEDRVIHIIESPDKGGAQLRKEAPSNTYILFKHSPNLKPGKNDISQEDLTMFSKIVERII